MRHLKDTEGSLLVSGAAQQPANRPTARPRPEIGPIAQCLGGPVSWTTHAHGVSGVGEPPPPSGEGLRE